LHPKDQRNDAGKTQKIGTNWTKTSESPEGDGLRHPMLVKKKKAGRTV